MNSTIANLTDVRLIFNSSKPKSSSLSDSYINRWYWILGFVILVVLIKCWVTRIIVDKCSHNQQSSRQVSSDSNDNHNYSSRQQLKPVLSNNATRSTAVSYQKIPHNRYQIHTSNPTSLPKDFV
jgi:p-aminobenzoyl-glutamate transporter AbgT